MYQNIIIGTGFAGAVVARELAEQRGETVLIIDSRNHIGGNCYDCNDEYGILIHQYGPHIFHTNMKHVYDYLSRFTEWYNFQHEVVGNVHGKMLPIPFNLNTLHMVYDKEKADRLEKILIEAYGEGARVPILELMKHPLQEIRDIADYVYENVFLHYTMKQWGKSPKDIDPSVSGRVPVVLSYDNRYFQDEYQGLPLHGFTPLFEKMLSHQNIKVRLSCKAKDILTFKDNKVMFDGKEYTGRIIYTGALDELFDCQFGRLPYRSLRFECEHFKQAFVQPKGVVNYTVSEDYTRITEYKYLTNQMDEEETTIMKEYPMDYRGAKGEIPYYAINNEKNQKLYEQYAELASKIDNFYVLGRLAEYKYYNIDAIVDRALTLAKTF